MIRKMFCPMAAYVSMMLVGLVMLVSGCNELTKVDPDTGKTQKQTIADAVADWGPVAKAMDPPTGGWSSVIYGGVSTAVNAALAINTMILTQRRKREALKTGNVIRAIDRNPNTPPAVEQVHRLEEKATINSFLNPGS